MLLSKMDSDDAGDGNIQEDRSHDYQTANEFVELMSRDHEFKYTSKRFVKSFLHNVVPAIF